MKPFDLARSLTERLLLPLMQGAEVRLVEPVGEARAVELGKALSGARLFDEVEELRLRAARRWVPVDELGDIAADEWLLVAALNDLLQLTNPALGRVRPRRTRARLAHLIERVIERAGPPRSVIAAVSRHALFSRVVELSRIDTQVSWWTGSDKFVGQAPPERLLHWPRLRKVRRRAEHVCLAQMADESAGEFAGLLDRWLAATPLTTLGTSQRSGVPFGWTGSALALTSTPGGRRVALRVLLSTADVPAALKELGHAAELLRPIDAGAFDHARAFVAEAEARRRQFAEQLGDLAAPRALGVRS
ncbi:MAG TPA: hypothetical protein VI197_04995 [Polyangiaceae bacterium]